MHYQASLVTNEARIFTHHSAIRVLDMVSHCTECSRCNGDNVSTPSEMRINCTKTDRATNTKHITYNLRKGQQLKGLK